MMHVVVAGVHVKADDAAPASANAGSAGVAGGACAMLRIPDKPACDCVNAVAHVREAAQRACERGGGV